MLYKVTKQYTRGGDSPVAQFTERNDAKMFIEAKLAEDAKMKVKVTYRLLEAGEVVEEFSESQQAMNASSDSGAGQRSSFQPTPLNTSARPAGMPANWVKEDDRKK